MNGDEIITDSEPIKEIDGVIYEVECKMVRPDNVDNISQSIPYPRCANSPQARNSDD